MGRVVGRILDPSFSEGAAVSDVPTNLGRLGNYVHLDSGDTVIGSFSSSRGPFGGNVAAIDKLFLDLAKECLSQQITIAENEHQAVDYGEGSCIVGYWNFVDHF